MRFVKSAFVAATAIGFVTLSACTDGTDLTPGNANITVNNTTNNNGAGSGSGGGTPTTPTTGSPQAGSIGNGQGTTRNAGKQADPFSIAAMFAAAGYGNTTSVVGLIDDTGFPTAAATSTSTGLMGKTFTVPAVWPPATAATGTQSLPLPDYITSVNYAGAYEPGVARAQQWTNGWTIKVNGNNDVWKFYGGLANTALASNTTAPVADGTCPAGTTVGGTLKDRIGSLANDEVGLFTGAAAQGDYDICTLPRRFGSAGTLTLTNDNIYELAAGFPGTYIGNGDAARTNANFALTASVLQIEPGTVIFGEAQEAMLITRGASIQAKGLREAPIIFTSINQLRGRFDGNTATSADGARGEWAGFAMMGQARDTQCANSQAGNFSDCDVALEGGVGNYGGELDNDNSGTLEYVIVRGAGNVIGTDNELNGITLGGVGRSTRINFVQVHRGLDDGIEFFGGSVFVGHAVLSGNDDDNIDGDNGWVGGVQHALILQENDTGNRAVEADSRFNKTPVTFPLISNVTALGPQSPQNQSAKGEDSGVLFREGIRVQLNNSIFTGNFGNNGSCLDLDDNTSGLTGSPVATFNRVSEEGGSPSAPGPHFAIRNTIIDCPINFTENDEGATP